MAKIILDWILKNATFKLYDAKDPVGKRLGGHDKIKLPDLYIILDVRAGSHILILGYFQAT
jgi:hypothetical protein